MIKRFITVLISLFSISISTISYAAINDHDVLKAHEAYSKEDVLALSVYAKQLAEEGHLLAPYVNYWLIKLKIDETDNHKIETFLAQNSDYAFVDNLRKEYLKKLGKHQDWDRFNQEYAVYDQENASVACYAAEAYYDAHKTVSALNYAKPMWMTAKERPSDCDRLFKQMKAKGVIDEAAVLKRFRLALGANRVRLAKSIIKHSRSYKGQYAKLINRAAKSPSKVIKKKQISFKSQFGRELNLYALIRMAKKDTWQAIQAFKKIESKFKPEEKSYFYSMLALYAAKNHELEAKFWFKKADFNTLNHEQIAWYARTALRHQDWVTLLRIIDQMPPELHSHARWRYWRARALIARNQSDEAKNILTDLAVERHYYGWLAQDELVNYKPKQLLHYKPKQNEISAIGKLPGVQRTALLHDLDLRWEARREWAKAIDGFGDKQLLAAAEYANRQQWYDLAINTADKTTELHDFSLRYLMPYRGLMRQAAKTQQIDETWVNGIARQESRFMHYAKSHAGAAGVMQLMPTTARWAAKKAGIKRYKRSMIYDLDTNIAIGTFYLRHTLDVMNGNKVMATAGYNAGPGRAKRWRGNTPLEGAIYAETIPFNETRNYVQRVMANTHQYAKELRGTRLSLKQRMGTIPAKTSVRASR